MDKITQEAHYRQRVLKYAGEYGVTASANRHRLSRKTVHKWKKRYDGTLESLKDRPRTPHHSPRKQTAEEENLVRRYARKYLGDLLLGYEKACAHGYKRSYGCFKRTAGRFVRDGKKKRKARKNKPYQPAAYPGQKVQMDVKYVPG